jgi:hypothetical protein
VTTDTKRRDSARRRRFIVEDAREDGFVIVPRSKLSSGDQFCARSC